MTTLDGITVAIDADTSSFRREIDAATTLANGFGRTMSRAFEGAIVRGRDFGDVMRSLALRLSDMAVTAALRPLTQGFGDLIGGLLRAPATGGGFAPLVTPFAKGGVIAAPGYFPLGGSLGLAGERGAEAILPLARGADGRLGVKSDRDARPLSLTVHITTPDAASFRRSEAYVSGAIARAVARGERSL
jgi:phage-related minor tail protein